MIRRFGWLVSVLLVLVLVRPVMAVDDQGKILGNLVNGTAGGPAAGGQALTLTITASDNTTRSVSGVSDSDGRFEFGGLATDPSYQYRISATYRGVDYSSPQLAFAGEPVFNATVKVYETTTDFSAISVTAQHMVIYPQTGALEVAEYQVYANNSDRTFIGSKPVTADGNNETLRIPLPAGAVHFEVDAGLVEGSYVQDDTGISDTVPLLPGTREIAYFYFLTSDTDAYILQHQFNYPTASFNLLVAGQEITVASTDLVRQSPVDMGGTVFQYFNGTGLEAGEMVSFNLSAKPAASGSAGSAGSDKAVIWLVVALLVIAGGVVGFMVLRRRLSRASPVGGDVQSQLHALAQLDDDFEDGKIAEADYARLRAEKKSELAEMLRRQRG